MKKKTWCHGTGVDTPDNKETNLLNMLVILHPTKLAFARFCTMCWFA